MVLPVILGDSTSPQGYHRFLTVGYIWAHAQLSSLWGLRKRASSLPDGQTGTAALTRSSETVPGALPFHWCPQSCPCTTLAQVFRGEQRLRQSHGPAALTALVFPPVLPAHRGTAPKTAQTWWLGLWHPAPWSAELCSEALQDLCAHDFFLGELAGTCPTVQHQHTLPAGPTCLQGPLVCTSQTNFPQLWTTELKRGFQRSVNVSAGSILTDIAEPFTCRGNQSSMQICAKGCKQIATSASLSVSGAEI